METTLHRQLKRLYASHERRTEISVGMFRADAAVGELLIEIQYSSLTAIRDKLLALLKDGRNVLLVKPFVIESVAWYRPSGRRRTVRRRLVEIFAELVHLPRVFPRTGLVVDVVAVRSTEERYRTSRRRGSRLVDRRLSRIDAIYRLRDGTDLWRLLPLEPPREFTSKTLAEALGVTVGFARMITYCLHRCGAAQAQGRSGRFVRYVASPPAVDGTSARLATARLGQRG